MAGLSPLEWLEQAMIGLIATLGFAVWFAVPRETLLRAGLVGMGGYLVRVFTVHLSQSMVVGSFFAALFIGVFGFYRARSFRYPRVLFTVTGIIPLVPGIATYRALILFSEGHVLAGLESATQGLLTMAALASGLTAARAIPMLAAGPRANHQPQATLHGKSILPGP